MASGGRAQSEAPNGRGFLWSDTAGWISLNCMNDWQGNGVIENRCDGPEGDYGVIVDVNNTTLIGNISGHAWSPNLGLICFGTTCGRTATFDLNNLSMVGDGDTTRRVAFVQGFARVEAHSNEGGDNNGGWIALNGTAPGNTAIEVGAWVNNNTLTINGSAWQRNSNGTGVGWIFFGDPPPGNAPDEDGDDWRAGDVGTDEQVDLPPDRETDCNNNIDDDLDKSYTIIDERDQGSTTGVDCQDYDCARNSNCPSTEKTETGEQCFDELDNDLDAYERRSNGLVPTAEKLPIDCDDPDCADARYFDETGNLHQCVSQEALTAEYNFCHNGEDDDRDGLSDCQDPDCANFITCVPSNLRREHPRCQGSLLCSEDCPDNDGDLVCDSADNCPPPISNQDQADVNANGLGDACDAWLETQQGALYGAGFKAPAKAPLPNATFCILSSGQIEYFRSAESKCASDQVRSFQALRYYLNIPRLLTGAKIFDQKSIENNGGVFYYDGDLVVDKSITWPNATGSLSGARTIIVKGNITFKKSSYYDASSAGLSLRNLASVAWIAEGDITFDQGVENVVGAFIATGKISTGIGKKPLTARGLMTASRFDFGRQFASQARGAEQIIYDGRAIFNPPPGLTDFVKALPIFRVAPP